MKSFDLLAYLKLPGNTEHLDDVHLRLLLSIKQSTLNNSVSMGKSLPPYIKINGFRKRLWPVEGVRKWLSESKEVSK